MHHKKYDAKTLCGNKGVVASTPFQITAFAAAYMRAKNERIVARSLVSSGKFVRHQHCNAAFAKLFEKLAETEFIEAVV